jgi:hypothetical protein
LLWKWLDDNRQAIGGFALNGGLGAMRRVRQVRQVGQLAKICFERSACVLACYSQRFANLQFPANICPTCFVYFVFYFPQRTMQIGSLVLGVTRPMP